jgi:hypothetical protein
MDKSHFAIAYPLAEDADSDEEITANEDFFLAPSHQMSIRPDGRWLKTSRTPGHNLDNQSVLLGDASIDQSFLAIAYPLVEDSDSFEESIADEDFFASGDEVSNLAVGNAWLKTSRTPCRNLDNESILLEGAIDQPFLAIAYPLAEDADTDKETTTDEVYALVEDPDSFEESTSDEEFFAFGNEASNLAVGNAWLKSSRTPGRNLDNESILPEDIDRSLPLLILR